MTVLLTSDEQLSDRYVFICRDADQEPILVVFAHYWQRFELADILRATADQPPQASFAWDLAEPGEVPSQ